jgi:hypothetical protein
MAATNNDDVTSTLHFEFDEKIHIGGTITNSEDIELIIDEENKTNVTRFIITIKSAR